MGCEDAPRGVNIPMAAHDILWYYAGKGVIPQGYPAVDREVQAQIQEIMSDSNSKYMTYEVLREWISRGDSPLNRLKKELKAFWKEFSSYAANPSKGLTMSEMRWPHTPLSLWLRFSARGDPEGMLPCDDGEYYIPRPANETVRTNAYFQQLLNQSFAKEEL